jgi:hypothetical protein
MFLVSEKTAVLDELFEQLRETLAIPGHGSILVFEHGVPDALRNILQFLSRSFGHGDEQLSAKPQMLFATVPPFVGGYHVQLRYVVCAVV